MIALVSHFAIDHEKVLAGRLHSDFAGNRQKSFWVLYGLDQLLCMLVIVAMVYLSIHQ